MLAPPFIAVTAHDSAAAQAVAPSRHSVWWPSPSPSCSLTARRCTRCDQPLRRYVRALQNGSAGMPLWEVCVARTRTGSRCGRTGRLDARGQRRSGDRSMGAVATSVRVPDERPVDRPAAGGARPVTRRARSLAVSSCRYGRPAAAGSVGVVRAARGPDSRPSELARPDAARAMDRHLRRGACRRRAFPRQLSRGWRHRG